MLVRTHHSCAPQFRSHVGVPAGDLLRLFDQLVDSPWREGPGRVAAVSYADRYEIRADLPGVVAADLDVTHDRGVLSIRARRREEWEEGGRVLLRSRRDAQIEERLRLPEDADADKLVARLKDGVLSVTVPRIAPAEAKKVTILEN